MTRRVRQTAVATTSHKAIEWPWHLGGLSVPELARRVWSEALEDELFDRAAALSYYFLCALFPALLFLTALIGLLPIHGLVEQLMIYIGDVLPPDSASVIQKTLDQVLRGASGSLLSIGALTTLWAASSGTASAITALNVAYHVEDDHPWWKRRLAAIALTLAFTILILSVLVLIVFGSQIGAAVAGRLGFGSLFTVAWNVVSILIVVFVVLLGIALVYYYGPAAHQNWRWVTPGSILALALWLAMSFGLRAYVAYFPSYNTTYGSIGGVILLVLWLYLSGLVLLVGAEMNSEIEFAAARRGAVTAKVEGERSPQAA